MTNFNNLDGNSQTIDLLKRARSIITKPGTWTKREFARNADGIPKLPKSKQAVSWCLLGACYKAVDEAGFGNPVLAEVALIDSLTNVLKKRHLSDCIPAFNDGAVRQSTVLRLVDDAIKLVTVRK